MNVLKTVVGQEWKLLLKLCQLVGSIYPQTPPRKLHLTLVILFNIFSNVYLMTGRIMMDSSQFIFVLSFPDQLSTLCLTLACISVIIFINYLFPRKFVEIFQIFQMFDETTGHRSNNKIHFRIVFGSFLEILLLVHVECYIWIRYVGFSGYKYYLGRNIQMLLMGINGCVLYALALELCSRFVWVGANLNEAFNQNVEYVGTTVIDLLEETKYLSKLHNYLCDLLILLNKLLGFNLLFDILFNIGFCIVHTCMVINYSLLNVPGSDKGIILSAISFMWILHCSVSISKILISFNITKNIPHFIIKVTLRFWYILL